MFLENIVDTCGYAHRGREVKFIVKTRWKSLSERTHAHTRAAALRGARSRAEGWHRGWLVDIKRIAQVGRGETLCSGNNIRVNRGRGLFAPYC